MTKFKIQKKDYILSFRPDFLLEEIILNFDFIKFEFEV